MPMIRRSIIVALILAVACLLIAPARADALGTFQAAGLEWQAMPNTQGINQPSGESYCQSLALGGSAGGWRLPTKDELLALYNARMLSIPGNTNGFYWSSTPAPPDEANVARVWSVDFNSGQARPLFPAYRVEGQLRLPMRGFVRCVRGASNAPPSSAPTAPSAPPPPSPLQTLTKRCPSWQYNCRNDCDVDCVTTFEACCVAASGRSCHSTGIGKEARARGAHCAPEFNACYARCTPPAPLTPQEEAAREERQRQEEARHESLRAIFHRPARPAPSPEIVSLKKQCLSGSPTACAQAKNASSPAPAPQNTTQSPLDQCLAQTLTPRTGAGRTNPFLAHAQIYQSLLEHAQQTCANSKSWAEWQSCMGSNAMGALWAVEDRAPTDQANLARTYAQVASYYTAAAPVCLWGQVRGARSDCLIPAGSLEVVRNLCVTRLKANVDQMNCDFHMLPGVWSAEDAHDNAIARKQHDDDCRARFRP